MHRLAQTRASTLLHALRKIDRLEARLQAVEAAVTDLRTNVRLLTQIDPVLEGKIAALEAALRGTRDG